jgi:hypothetical protein
MPSVITRNVVMLCRGTLSKARKIICSVCLSIKPWTFKDELSKGSLIYIFFFFSTSWTQHPENQLYWCQSYKTFFSVVDFLDK